METDIFFGGGGAVLPAPRRIFGVFIGPTRPTDRPPAYMWPAPLHDRPPRCPVALYSVSTRARVLLSSGRAVLSLFKQTEAETTTTGPHNNRPALAPRLLFALKNYSPASFRPLYCPRYSPRALFVLVYFSALKIYFCHFVGRIKFCINIVSVLNETGPHSN